MRMVTNYFFAGARKGVSARLGELDHCPQTALEQRFIAELGALLMEAEAGLGRRRDIGIAELAGFQGDVHGNPHGVVAVQEPPHVWAIGQTVFAIAVGAQGPGFGADANQRHRLHLLHLDSMFMDPGLADIFRAQDGDVAGPLLAVDDLQAGDRIQIPVALLKTNPTRRQAVVSDEDMVVVMMYRLGRRLGQEVQLAVVDVGNAFEKKIFLAGCGAGDRGKKHAQECDTQENELIRRERHGARR